MKHLRLIFISIIIIASAQLLLKYNLKDITVNFNELFNSFITIFSNPLILFALFLLFLGGCIWLVMLSKTDLSLAYPMLSLGYIVVSLVSWFLFNESMNSIRLIGIIFVGIGVFLMARS
jgi:drug/metabolite transporter (DMT)-like permease